MKKYYARCIEKHSWLLLLLLIVPGLLVNDDDYRIATYSYLLVIAIVALYWLLNPIVIKDMLQFRGVQLFAPFLIYSLFSVFWSTGGYATNVPVRCIGMCAVLTLCYLLVHYQQTKFSLIETTLLAAGTLCLILSFYKSGSGFALQHISKGHGVFMHHVYVSWLAGILLLLLLTKQSQLSILHCVLFCFLLGCIILSGGRGGLLVFVCGYLCMLFRQDNRYREKQVILCLIIPVLLSFVLNPQHLLKLVNKGTSSRSEIFQVHFKKASDTSAHLIFGRGLNTNTDLVIKKRKIPHFHSLYLTTVYKEGMIGLCLYLLMLSYIIYQGLRAAEPRVWVYIIIGMSMALLVDASDFFVWPSALMTCFVIPLFLALFTASPTTSTTTSPTTAASQETPG